MSLPKKNILRKNLDFRENKEKGKKIKSGSLVLSYSKNKLEYSRVAIVISQKISKKAVVRNKIRRRMKALIAQELSRIIAGYDLIFFVRSGIIKEEFQKIENNINNILKKSGILSDNYEK
jgi:ribonuclease P protein component